jgi:hypothetical protein
MAKKTRDYYKDIKKAFNDKPNYFFVINDFIKGETKEFKLDLIPINHKYASEVLNTLVDEGFIDRWIIRSRTYYKKRCKKWKLEKESLWERQDSDT